MSSTESNVTMRGYNDDASASQGILGLVDGRSVYNEFFGSVIWESLPVSLGDIESVEVVRGPGSFLYGPNAMHGLVNIVTKSPLDYENDEIFLSGSYGSYQSVLGSLIYVRREGKSGLKVKVVRDDINEFEPRNDNAKDKMFFEGRFETEFNVNHRLELTGGISQQKFNVLIPQFAGLPDVTFATEAQEPFLKLEYTWEEFRAKIYWSQLNATGVPDAVYAPFSVISDSATVDLQYSITSVDRHTLTVGTGYRVAMFHTDDQDVSDGRHKTGLTWAFIQDKFEVIENALWVTGGVRVDAHSVTGDRTSPRLAVVWRMGEQHYLRASAGYGFRNPSLRELWFDMPVLGGPGTIQGNKDLDPEQMRSFELGYWSRPNEKLQLTSTFYFNLVDDLVEFRAISPTAFAPLNVFKEEAFGVELGVEYQFLTWLWGFTNYTYGIRRDRDTHDKSLMAPRHKANAGLRVRYPGPQKRDDPDYDPYRDSLTAMLWATFFDDVDFVDTAAGVVVGSTDDYILLNGRIAWKLPVAGVNSRVFVQAFNLLDHDHREQPPGDPYGLILTAGLEVTW